MHPYMEYDAAGSWPVVIMVVMNWLIQAVTESA